MASDATSSRNSATADIRLRVLHTSDLHGALRGFDYLADKPSETIGLSRTATLVRAARAGAANTLLFDTGDALQGSPVCDLTAETGLAPGQVHPMIAAMNALGYDGFTPGNHDFNHGSDFLFRALEGAAFPVVSANFLHRGPVSDRSMVFASHAILKRRVSDSTGAWHDLRVAIIGCLPPQTIDWDHALADRFDTDCMVAAVRRTLADIRAEGCDLTILLAHSGIDPAAPEARAENALIDLAALDGLDLILGGHTHLTFPPDPATPAAHESIDTERGRIHGTPVLISGFSGNHLGQADLVLSLDAESKWIVTEARCSVTPLARRDALGIIAGLTPEDPDLVTLTEPAHAETLRYNREPIGRTLQPLHSFFALLGNDAATQLVAGAQTCYLANAIAGTPLAKLPMLSAANPFKTGRLGGPDHYTHIPAGPLTRRSVTDLYIYPNTICAVKVTGRQLREWLEHSASLFCHVEQATPDDTPLLDDAFPGYKFDILCGLTYEIDLSRPARYDSHRRITDPAAWRIRSLCHESRPIIDDQVFLVASNSYRIYGIGFSDPPPEVVFTAPVSNRDILLDYIRQSDPLLPNVVPVWSFAPLGGARLRFETSPLARAYLGEPQLPPLEDLGNTPEGFARFRVTL
ncbi:bifunctional 2',3'-cyclic-nucleotide 2'-phosphodiesterase/3'-nucleotidase [Marimonas arenosa]|uniref:Bifunctional 2',3'-cyclic-nucleotide 2'-phosphodiesterase/3'-nucleotidase n=1 Tax=Marimonas arenosa TaxID=1795305 RepID=A0AAE3WD43_9RHOB|nr:bifunctional 2',3'-cyclic-nucleotide 2'-phosphodiesterase/3'-nucleotidase [Marimonas arenosa]MDQ2089567.1 bifunctional 2',3'-cyclic-nucleotide 2'-phosphodiesterase/3'-nucleotidase [Marimonas arenosa]